MKKRKKSIPFRPTHKLAYDRGIWIPVIVNWELLYAITQDGKIFAISHTDEQTGALKKI